MHKLLIKNEKMRDERPAIHSFASDPNRSPQRSNTDSRAERAFAFSLKSDSQGIANLQPFLSVTPYYQSGLSGMLSDYVS
jgi:hypothetical protein